MEKLQTTTKRKWPKRLLWLVLFLLFLLLVLVVLFQTSSFQNWAVDKVGNYLSEKTATEVTIDHIDLDISKGLELEGFRVIGAEGDTMVHAKALSVALNESLTSLINNRLDINKVRLDDPSLYILTKKGQTKSNIAEFISHLGSKKKKKKKKTESTPMKILFNELDVRSLNLLIVDENKNTKQEIVAEQATVTVDKLLEDGVLAVNKVKLVRPDIQLSKLSKSITVEKETGDTTITKSTSAVESDSLLITVASLIIEDGEIGMSDATKLKNKDSRDIDYANFQLSDLNLDLNNLSIKDLKSIDVSLNNLSFQDDKGFVVRKISAENISVDSTEIYLDNYQIVTDRTNLKRSIKLSYNSFDDFSRMEQNVYLNANFSNSKVFVGDILHFASDLKGSKFFLENANRVISLSGKFRGPVDRLSGNDVEIKVDEDMVLKANFSTRNISKKDRELINFGVKELKTDMAFLKEFIPGFEPPANFYKLGEIDFKGRFDGYLKDFVAYGSLDTKLGQAFVDMRLDVKNGNELARYSGELSLEEFSLGEWSDSDDFGIVNFSASIEDGKGLTLNSVDTELGAVIETITYKGYEYKDFVMDGKLSKNEFDGEFAITDENIDLIFDGNIQLKDEIPYLDFKANVEQINLAALNLSKDPFLFKGNIDINGNGKELNSLQGYALASDVLIMTNDTTYVLDTLSVNSIRDGEEGSIDIYSDIASLNIDGTYDLNYLVPSFKQLLKKNYPHYTQNWDVDDRLIPTDQDITFEANISDTKNILELAGIKDLRIKNFNGTGALNTKINALSIDGVVPYVDVGGNTFFDTKIKLNSKDAKGDLVITVDSTYWGGKSFNPIDLRSEMTGDTVNVFIGTSELADSLQKLEISGQLIPHEKGYQLSMANKNIEMLGASWDFTKDNEIIFGEDYLNIDNLRLTDGDRSIIVDDVKNKGISIYLADFNFSSVSSGVIKYKPMAFAGKGDLSLFVDDLFVKQKTIDANVFIPTFTINQDTFGTLEVDLNKPDGQPFDVLFSLGDDDKGITVDGTLDPDKNNYLDAEVKSNDFPLKIFEYILKYGIKDVYGEVDLDGKVTGPIDNLDIDAEAYLNNSALTVIYTGVTYTMDNQRVTCTDKLIDFTGVEIRDANGNPGTITGGIYHDMFTRFGINANLSGEDVIAINTTKDDNPRYYGFGRGDVSVDFTGPFEQLDMKIAATTKQGTEINIPIKDDKGSTAKNFIEFIDSTTYFSETSKKTKNFKIEGLDIEMDLTMTPQAQVNIIFDESKGDIIEGKGRGDLKMYITRYGDFDMYGTYGIEEGNYLFTAWGIVAKPFTVRRGGTVRWTGDPVNAELAIQADYSVRTPMRVFLDEYLAEGTQAFADASNRTEVDLILELGGTLYSPQVKFDLEFPNLTGELASVADNKMRALKSSQIDLNNQVLGLIVFNSFLPGNSAGSGVGADIGSAGISTVSEFISSQLSGYFTGLINDALTEDGLIAGIDFEIGLNKNSFYGVETAGSDVLPDEFEVNLKNKFRFLDERLSLGLGGNYVRQSVLNSNYFIGDFVLEYYLTSDRKLKLKVYGKYDLDETALTGGRRQRYGVGIGYRTEFGSLVDFKEGLKEQLREDMGRDESK